MSLEDALGAVDPQEVLNNQITQRMPDVAKNDQGNVDPQSVLNRLIRKGMAPPTAPAKDETTDFSKYGKTKDEIAKSPPEDEETADFSQYGQTADEIEKAGQPKPAPAPTSSGLSVGARSLAQGPVSAVGNEVVGPAGPTTSTRMDRFTDELLEHTGLLVMVGKAERGPAAVQSIARHGASYLIAVGGAAILIAKSIKSSKVVAFPELGMEAIHEFKVEQMPVTVAVDSTGNSIHESGPKAWRRA